MAAQLDATRCPEQIHARSLSLSRGGSDAMTLREFDLDTKSLRRRRIRPCRKPRAASNGSTPTRCCCRARYGEGMATTSGYARTVRLWRRGEAVDRAPVLFEVPADHMAAYCSRRRHRRQRRGCGSSIGSTSSISTSGSATEAGPRTRSSICRPTSGWKRSSDWLAVKLRAAWTVAGKTYAPDTVLGISLSAFLAGDRDFTIVFEPRRAAGATGLFLDRRQAGVVRFSTSCGRCSKSARRRQSGWTRAATAGPSRNRRGRCLAPRPPRSREQRRSARQHAGPADAAFADADRGRRQLRHC